MSKEELMRPRYKVIALYPGCFWKVGDIFKYDNYNCFRTESQPSIPLHGSVFTEHPHLFKKLEWYEEREIEEMPEYVKVVIDDKPGFVHKVEGWVGNNAYGVPMYDFKNRVGYVSPRSVTDLQPATATEYEQYINQKEKQ